MRLCLAAFCLLITFSGAATFLAALIDLASTLYLMKATGCRDELSWA